MRLGERQKTRGRSKAGAKGKPHHITGETIIGQVSPDLVTTYFAPKLLDIASNTLEQYASDLLSYDDELRSANRTADAEIKADGSLQDEPTVPLPPSKPLYYSQYRVDELSSMMTEVSDHFFAKGRRWKVHVNAAKFERTLDEKYGVFRPFITEHPEIEQFIRSVQRRYATGYFSPFRKQPPPISRSTAIILLFMMQRGKVRWDILLLTALFLIVGLQPWALVAIVLLIRGLLHRRKRRAISPTKRSIPSIEPYYRTGEMETDHVSEEEKRRQKCEYLRKPVGSPHEENEQIDTDAYDTIVVGTGPSALFAAALLSRAGRRVLFLSSATDASGCLSLQDIENSVLREKWATVPFDVQNCNISRVMSQQKLLSPALSTSTDCQGGIRFAKIGSEADGYAFEILSIPGVGTEKPNQEHPFVLKAGGVSSLMEDTATFLGDNWPASDGSSGDSLTGQYIDACDTMNAGSGAFYLSKILPEAVNKLGANSEYKNAAIRNTSVLLNTCFPMNTHLRSLMAGSGMKGENLVPSSTCMAAHITNLCSTINREGMHYPVGGPRALCHALANSIVRCGGRVVTKATVTGLLFDENVKVTANINVPKTEANEPRAPCCVGVELVGGRQIRFSSDRYKKNPCPVVISMEGFIQTFIRFLSDDIRTTYKVPRGVPALSERRPVVHFLFALKGTAQDLNVTGADYYRLPGAAIALDEVDPETSAVTCGEIGWSTDFPQREDNEDESGDAIEENVNKEETTDEVRRGKRKKQVNKFLPGSSWMRISFPSAKDPSFEERHGKITTCVVTVEADDELVTRFDTKPKIFVCKKASTSVGIEMQRLAECVKKDLLEMYPQLEGKMEHAEIRGPFQMGLSHNAERYAAKGIRASTPYPCLYAGGPDLTVGDSLSGCIVGGWLVANAVSGYDAIDLLFLQKNITSDLEQFIKPPVIPEIEDVAVPFTTKVVEDELHNTLDFDEDEG